MTGPTFGVIGELQEAVLALGLNVESMTVRERTGPGVDDWGWMAVCYDPRCQVGDAEWTSPLSRVWPDVADAVREHAGTRHGGGM